jgi:hypothetical protein
VQAVQSEHQAEGANNGASSHDSFLFVTRMQAGITQGKLMVSGKGPFFSLWAEQQQCEGE